MGAPATSEPVGHMQGARHVTGPDVLEASAPWSHGGAHPASPRESNDLLQTETGRLGIGIF